MSLPQSILRKQELLSLWRNSGAAQGAFTKMSPFMLFLLLPLFFGDIGWCESDCSFKNLLNHINLQNASIVRPVRDWKTTSIVYIDLTLYTIVDLDMRKQTAIIFVWFYVSWNDEFIRWIPDEFCGITKLLANSNYFWKPDLYIYEMTEDDNKSPQIPFYKLHSYGKVTNAMPLRLVVTCNLDIFKFPFDNQTCKLSFGSYVYPVSELIMWPKSNSSVVNKNAMDVFATKNDWMLQEVTVHNRTVTSIGENYSQVVYSIYIKRASVIYVINLIIPVCFLVFLDIASMFIQSYSARLDFKITIVLGFSVLLLILNDMLPNSDNTPMLGIFCCICMAMMVLSIIGTIATSYLTNQSTTNSEVPAWIKILVLRHLARILFFKKTPAKDELVTPVAAENGPENAIGPENALGPENATKSEINEEIADNRKAMEKGGNVRKEVKLLKRILLEILKIHNDLMLDIQQRDAKTEWSIVAQIVDRLVLFMYFGIVTLVFVVMICVWAI